MNAPSTLIDALRTAFASSSIVRLAILFGSRARGTPRRSSDFDIGILPIEPSLSLKVELDIASRLSSIVGADVDLVRLDVDDPLLGREVAVHGQCLFEAEPGLFAAYRAEAMSRWIDFDERVAPQRVRFLRRLAAR